MTADATAPAARPAPAHGRRLRVSAPPRLQRPAQPPTAPRGPGPTRRIRVGGPPLPRRGALDADGRHADAPTRPGDPTSTCCAVVRAAVEVLRGERPVAQLARWVTPQVHDQLAHRARLVRAATATGAAGRADPRTSTPVTVRRVRLMRLGDSAAEATVVLDDGGRVRAAAVRLEHQRSGWKVTVLELG